MMSVISSLAERLADEGFILRSGAADGADTAFELGHENWRWGDNWGVGHPDEQKEIFIAWNGFSDRTDQEDGVYCLKGEIVRDAEELASTLHPAWDKLSRGAKALHARNCFQVLGANLVTPSKFWIGWAPVDKHGAPKGGTRTSWVLARMWNIPCFNLAIPADLERINKYLEK